MRIIIKVNSIPSHRVMAIFRGDKQKILKVKIAILIL